MTKNVHCFSPVAASRPMMRPCPPESPLATPTNTPVLRGIASATIDLLPVRASRQGNDSGYDRGNESTLKFAHVDPTLGEMPSIVKSSNTPC